MPTHTTSQPDPSDSLADLIGIRGCRYVIEVSSRAPSALAPADVLNGVLAALDVSGIDLSVCTDEADVTALVAAYLNAGRRKLIDDQRGQV